MGYLSVTPHKHIMFDNERKECLVYIRLDRTFCKTFAEEECGNETFQIAKSWYNQYKEDLNKMLDDFNKRVVMKYKKPEWEDLYN